MRCRHCFAPQFEGEDPRLDEIEVLARNLGTMQGIGLGGGEAFLRRDLTAIARTFAAVSPNLSICITTNGYSPERIARVSKEILAGCPWARLRIVLSLDGLEGTHDDIRQTRGAFESTMATARALAPVRSESPRFSLGFVATLCTINYEELPALARYVRAEFDTSLDYHLLTGEPRDSSLRLPPLDELARAMRAIDAANGSPVPIRQQVFTDLRLRTLSERRQVIPCQAGSVAGVVRADWEVRLCHSLPSLGNLRHDSFRSIWQSEAARRQRASIRRGECWCHRDCYIARDMGFYWKIPLIERRARMRQAFREHLAAGQPRSH